VNHPPHLRVVRPGEQPPTPPAAPAPAAPLRTSWTADQLMAAEFPPPRWAVPGVLAEGVNLLAGPPKVGKSWLSLGLALAVAAGGRALASIAVTAGPVLYLALEDTPRRLQSRMGKMLAGQPAPTALTLATACPPLPEGGAAAIGAWLNRNPAARMVVIDVFAKVRGRAPAGMSAYEADYAAIGHAKRLADEHAVAVMLVHHIRKAGSDDYLTEVSGTNGLAGAADATLVLKRPRGQADAVLYVTGRDVDEAEYALRFDAAIGAWCLLDGPAGEYAVSDTRAAILRHVRAHPDSTPKAIADYTGLSPDNVRKACQRMAADGQLTADGAGRYRLPETAGGHESVHGVPRVPGPVLTSANTADHEGHRRDTPAADVPHPSGDGAGEAR
jgi:AAA domain/MarR family